MEKDLGHLFISARSSQFFYKTDFEQYLFNGCCDSKEALQLRLTGSTAQPMSRRELLNE